MIAFQLQQLHYAKHNKVNNAKHKTGTVVVSIANNNNNNNNNNNYYYYYYYYYYMYIP